MIEAARLKRARWRLRVYFLGSAVIMAFLFLILAALIIRWVGVEHASYWATLVFAAAMLAGGAFAIIYLTSVLVHIARRLANRQPIMEIED